MRRIWFGLMLIVAWCLAFGVPERGGAWLAQEATPRPAEPVTQTLTLWLPADLFSPTDTETLALLTEQIEAFVAEYTNVDVVWRFKRVGEIGGVLSTLRTASSVAPGVLPDLTLMRRQDLMNAQRAGLIQSWEGLLPSSLIVSLQQRLSIGQIEDSLYGMPYTLDVLHLAYHSEHEAYGDWSYEGVLARDMALVLPLGRTSAIPPIIYAQYRASGAMLNAAGVLRYDAEAVGATLAFYEALRAQELIDVSVLDFTSSADYLPVVEVDTERIFLLSSSQYLGLQEVERDLHIAPLPTQDGEPVSLLNGWMWVLVSNTAEQQQLASALVAWLMESDNQAGIARRVNRLPSQPSALNSVIINQADRELFNALIDNAYLPLVDGEGDTFSRAFEEALIGIVREEQTVEQALEAIERVLGE